MISPDEAVAITEARMALEALLARKAAERVTDARGRAASAATSPTLRAALEAGDLLKYSTLIQRLHELVRDVAAQPVAAGLVDRLQAQLVRHQFQLSLRPGRPQVSLRELTALVEAIADRDPDRAEAAAVTPLPQRHRRAVRAHPRRTRMRNVVVTDPPRADAGDAEQLGGFGVATVHEALGPGRLPRPGVPAGLVRRPDRRHRRHGALLAGGQPDDPRRRRAVPAR